MITTLATAFLDPPAQFRPMMFWIWNGEVTRERIDADIREMKDKGCGGFFIHPMGENFRLREFIRGQSPPYLSAEYFELVRYAVQRAAEAGLYAWLYDEGGWPSGTAQGRVVEGHPELRGKVLTPHRGDALPQGEVVATVLLGQGQAATIIAQDNAQGNGPVVHFVVQPGGYPVDLMDPAAVRRFIQVTHERYRQYVGEYFGTTVPGIFTDEPRVGGLVGTGEIPWTPNLLQAFEAHHGYDLRPYLPLLFSEGTLGFDPATYYQPNTMQAVRCAFYDTWTRLFREAYWDQLNSWCAKHNLLHVGHVGGEDNLPDHINGGFGEFFRTAGTLHAPGIDAIWRQLWPTGPKRHFPLLAASAAHQKNEEPTREDWPQTGLAVTESFGVYGLGLTFAQMKWVTDYQFVRGINVMCPMAYYMHTEDGLLYRTMDYMGPKNPLWPYYHLYAEYVGRLSLLCRAGIGGGGVGIYYPIEAMWAHEARQYAASFETICGLLEDQQVQFDILGGDALLSAEIEEGLLATPGSTYELLIVPEMPLLRRPIAQKLADFRVAGGRIVFLGDYPQWIVDGPTVRPTSEALPSLTAAAFLVALPRELDRLMAAFGDEPARWALMQLDGLSSAYFGGPWLQRFAGKRLVPGTALIVPLAHLGAFAEILGLTTPRIHLGVVERVQGLRIMSRVLETESLHLVVNERDSEVHPRFLIAAESPLQIETWDPTTGSRTVLAEHTEPTEATLLNVVLRPGQSLFIVVVRRDSAPRKESRVPGVNTQYLLGTLGTPQPVQGWAIIGGDCIPLEPFPQTPSEAKVAEQGRWDLIPGYEYFSGTMMYRLTFEAPEEWARGQSAILLTDVRYVAEGKLNGQTLRPLIWEPYQWDTTGLIRAGVNELEVYITNTLANAALDPEAIQEAKQHGWWNTYRERTQPMMEESIPSGVNPVVRLLVGSHTRTAP